MNKKLNVSESVTPAQELPMILKDRKALGKEKLERFMREELKTVKGIFQLFETPGGSVKVTVKKYPGIEAFSKDMTDGQEYEIPLYVARFLNGIDVTAEAIGGKLNTCGFVRHEFLVDKNGVPLVTAGKVKRRMGFQSMEFAGSAA